MKKPSSGGIAANDVSPPEKTKFKTRYRYYCKASYAPIGYKTFRFFRRLGSSRSHHAALYTSRTRRADS